MPRSRRWSPSIVAKPRAAIAIGKEQFYRQIESGIEAAYAIAGQAMACNMMDESALEGVQAFIDKRPPGKSTADASANPILADVKSGR